MKSELSVKNIVFILFAFFIYATSGILTKLASMFEILSWQYVCSMLGAIIILSVYALLWQQIIRRVRISDAYIFRGSVVVWELIFFASIFGEQITIRNIIGAVVIVIGITFYVLSEREQNV